jgi:hypothetical protein
MTEMQEQNQTTPTYYDGSGQTIGSVSDEMTESIGQEETMDNGEWRRFVGFNPFGHEIR